MSQADDIDAINDYFQRTEAKTSAASVDKTMWNIWYKAISLTWFGKNLDPTVYDKARQMRDGFNIDNATSDEEKAAVQDVMKSGLKTEDTSKTDTVFTRMPAKVTGSMPTAEKIAIGAGVALFGALLLRVSGVLK